MPKKLKEQGETAVQGAELGAALLSPLGPTSSLLGGVGGAVAGFILADQPRVVPIDMIAIPAYQYSAVLQGDTPVFQIYIKEGELIGPVMKTDAVVAADTMNNQVKPKRKLSAWNKYVKQDKNKIFFKSGKNKGKLDLSKMSKKFRALQKKGGK